jgi:hypothetical protein
MLKFIQNTRISSLVFASAALFAVIAATPVTPAAAQGVPAGLLRLDSPTPALNAQANLVDEVQQPKARTHVRKHHIAQ